MIDKNKYLSMNPLLDSVIKESDDMKCPKCNKTYDDNFKFCPFCGEAQPEPKICPKCEFETYDEYIFCPRCGTELIERTESYVITKLKEKLTKYEKIYDYDNIIECCNKIIELDPSNEKAWHNKGTRLSRLGRNEEARECYDKIDKTGILNLMLYREGMFML